MNGSNLTPNARKLLKVLHGEYRKRIRHGQSRSDAAEFGSSKAIHEQYLPKWSFDEVDAACTELLRADLLDGFRADGYVYCASLSDAGIAFNGNARVENVPKFVGWVLELAQAIRSLLLG